MEYSDIKPLIYYERFVNNGSPTGLTFSFSSSVCTSPLYCSGSFRLPFIEIPREEINLYGNQWFEYFSVNSNKILFPVHPDLVNLLNHKYYKQTTWQPKHGIEATPTASPRTVLLLQEPYEHLFLKLDYPLILGRFTSKLFGPKLFVGPHICSYLSTLKSAKPIYYLPEISALEATVYENNTVSGAILRLNEVWRVNGKPVSAIKLIPAFSLFGRDHFSGDFTPLVLNLLDHSQSISKQLLEKFIYPVLDDFFTLSFEHGLIPEAQAQNFLFGYCDLNSSPLVVWRDFQGFFRDESRAHSLLLMKELGEYHLIRSKNRSYAQKRRSYLYDWILGHYFFDPLIESVDQFCSIDINFVIEGIKERANSYLKLVEKNYLPNGYWYSLSLRKPRKEEHLSLHQNRNPRYR